MTNDKTISFKSSGPSGDLISFLPAVKTACENLGAKADIYMWLDQKAFYYQGAEHPYESMFPGYAFDMMKPLIEAQPYVNSFQVWKGQEILVDMDVHRTKFIGMPYGSIHRWLGFCYPDTQCDLSKSWLEVPWSIRPLRQQDEWLESVKQYNKAYGKVLINRTSRYTKPYLTYWFMEKHKEDLMFCGLPEEHQKFQKDWGFELPLLVVSDFLELAIAIKCCRFFIGNQSMCFAIAEAMKTPRLLEVCEFAPNVIPMGGIAYDYQFQEGLVYLVDKMMKEL